MNIARHEPFNMLTNAVVHDGIIYTTGLTAKDASGDVKTQTVQVLEEIDRLLALCGSKKSRSSRR